MSESAPPPRVDADAIYDDFVSRLQAGEAVDFEAVCRAHADIAAELRRREAARALLDRLLPGSLANDREETGAAASADAESAGDSGTIQELLARLHSAGPRGSRYRIVNEIARGGMGVVLRVIDTELRRKLAMKVARAPGGVGDKASAAETRALDRFLQEAQITSQLDHPGVVPVYEIGIGADSRVFFTMRYVRGQTLKEVFELVRDHADGWTQLRAVNVLLRVCETMSYAHDRSTIHRDLKPANVMVGRFGEVYVMDWGLARVMGQPDAHEPGADAADREGDSRVETLREDERDATPDSPRLTVDGEVLGTPAYMAPEQAGGEHDKVGPRSDVYAVGAMLYHLIAGDMPYVSADERVSSHAVRLRVIAGPPRPLHDYGRKSPSALVAVCEKAMARQMGERYADMRELASDLRAYVEGRVVAAYETGSWAETKMWVRRNKALAGLLSGIVAAVLPLTLIILRNVNEAKRVDDLRESVERLRLFERREGDLDFGRDYSGSAAIWWMNQADRLIASGPALREEMERLRNHVRSQTQRRQGTFAHYPRQEELDAKRHILQWRRRMLGDETWPQWATVQGDVDLAFRGIKTEQGLRAINSSVFRQVRPDEPRTVGDEIFACALAERITSWPNTSQVLPTYHDTYAFALFRVGEFDRAVAVQTHALELERKLLRDFEAEQDLVGAARQAVAVTERRDNLDILNYFRTEWRDVQRQRQLTEDLSAEVMAMEQEIEDESWARALEPHEAWYRDLARTVRGLDKLARRRATAADAIEHSKVWQQAITGVAGMPKYECLTLTQQIDLLPLGPDPASGLWEFVHLPSGVAPKRGPDGRFGLTPETGIVFVLLPGGLVPLQDGQEAKPVHSVRLDPFFISKYELTEQQWARIGGAWTRRTLVDSPHRAHVLSGISCARAQIVLSQAGGWLSLPTGAQWEYACRAGTTTRWWPGDDIESLRRAAYLQESRGPWDCGSGRPNGFGLHDTLGHVAEWCIDGPDDDEQPRSGDGLRRSVHDRRWLRGGDRSTPATQLCSGFDPARPGEEDLDDDGDCDLRNECAREDSPPFSGVRPMRPVLR